MKTLNWNDYPLTPDNPANPIWLTITGRWQREPHKSIVNSQANRNKNIVIEVEIDGSRESFTSYNELNERLGYSEGKDSGVYKALKRLDKNGYFKAFGQTVKVIKMPKQVARNKQVDVELNGVIHHFTKKVAACEFIGISRQYFDMLYNKSLDGTISAGGKVYKISYINQKVET